MTDKEPNKPIDTNASHPKNWDYNVGYGKPPKSGQFKKGQSGNRKGRPKGSTNNRLEIKIPPRTVEDIFLEELERKIPVKGGGDPINAITAVIRAQLATAIKGSVNAQNSGRNSDSRPHNKHLTCNFTASLTQRRGQLKAPERQMAEISLYCDK